MTVQFTLSASAYRCDPCTRRQGTVVSELVRMIKAPALLNGELVGDEHWGCPICLEPKFPVKKPRKPRSK
ncbi:hypothetical protein [Methylobacterium sp. WL120]|uniref:hypothetical protein n=1 Tax=Methylobacterium sp. WL120 TaxID=2603887 RepID=UPI0011C73D67|nr:hypothetical protein [Methylobacterium sp. WL120]TXM68188.1 hypothetical protein FV229_08430 [Methylobacterium sp. WL120]